MKNLAQLRKLMDFSRDDLAGMIVATAADVKAWESGKRKPDLATKRDLALLFGVDIDFLDGRMGASPDCVQWFPALQEGDEDHDDDEVSGYWGQVGIKLWGSDFTKWYPITTRTVCSIQNSLATVSEGGPGLIRFETLNNRLIFFRSPAVERVIFLERDQDPVRGDWRVSADDVQGKGLEIYRALTRRMHGDKIKEESKTYSELVVDDIKRFGLNNKEDFHKLLSTTFIHLSQGRSEGVVHSYRVIDQDISDIYEVIDARRAMGRMVEIRDEENGLKAYHNWSDVIIIDTPLLPYLEFRKEQEEHFQDHYHDEEIDGDF